MERDDSRAVFGHAKTAGYLYQAALRHELSNHFAVTWTPPVTGMAELADVPTKVLREFSTRRRQIEVVLANTGGAGRAAAQAACLKTRQRKTHHSLAQLRQGWAQRSTRMGSSPAELLKVLIPHQRPWQRRPAQQDRTLQVTDLSPAMVRTVAEQVLGPAGVTAQRTGFDRKTLVQALAVTVPVEHGGDAQQLESLADQLLARPDVLPLASDGGEGKEALPT